MRRILSPIATALLVLGISATAAEAAPADKSPDRYIVVFHKGTSEAAARSARDEAKGKGGQVHHVYSHALQGFAASLPGPALDGVRRNPNVAFIEADAEVALSTTQTSPPWGLDRIDQRNRPLSTTYDYTATAANVTAYVIDTGVRTSHSQFGGRAVSGYDSVDGGAADDCNGHGTHVAGTVGGTAYGVAKAVRIVAVRVLTCQGSGTNSGVIAGVDWVTSHHQAGQPAVANMSLGGSASSALDTAVANSIADGITYTLAAGNENKDACQQSPARLAAAITVGGTTSTDARASWSNFGTCLDLFAPGAGIQSAWHTSDTGVNTISGTSMAAPHAAGAAALYLSANPSATPAQVRDALVNTSTTGVLTNIGAGSPNRLLYTLGGASAPAPAPASTCARLPEQFTGSLSGTGAAQFQPNGTYYTSAVAGTHYGCLDGPAGVDFDLYLQRWNGSTWVTVASALSVSPDESISYSGEPGYYIWKVYAYSGSGPYAFGMQRP